MKKVIFICLLSLSMCLSKPNDVPADKSATQHVDANVATQHVDANVATQHVDANVTPPAQLTQAPNKETEKVSSPPTTHAQENITPLPGNAKNSSTAPITEKADNGVTTKPNETKSNETTTASAPASNSKPAPNDKPSPQTATTQKPTPPDHDKSSSTTTTTVKPEPSKPTETPKEGDKIVQARGFDGASFIGGIILTLGLLAIGFMGFKYYKNQTERNYHTL